MSFPHIRQHDERDCGAACLSMILRFYGAKVPVSVLREKIKVDNIGANIYGIVKGATEYHLDAEALDGDYEELISEINEANIRFPIIARIIDNFGFEHYVVVYDYKDNMFFVADPAQSKVSKVKEDFFKSHWLGQIITFSRSNQFEKLNIEKGKLNKYFAFIRKQKKMLFYVFILSLVVAFINISGSVIFQYILDDSLTVNEANEVYVLDENGNLVPDDESEHIHIESDNEYNTEDDYDDKDQFIKTIESIESKLSIIFANINTVCITLICMYLFCILIGVFRGYLLVQIAKRVDIPLTMNYYDHLEKLPIKFFGTRKTGELLSRFEDTSKIRDAISSTTLTIMLDSLMAIGGAIILCFINVKLFLITLAMILVYAIIVFFFRKPIRTINHELMEQDAQVTSYLKESIDGIEVIKSHNYENKAINKTKDIYTKFAEKSVKVSMISITQNSLIMGIESIGIILLLWSGTYLCIKDILTISELFMFYYLISYFLDPVKNLINLQPELQTAMVAAERLNDILDADIEDNQKQEITSIDGDIQVNNIDFRYGYRELVLENVTMNFKAGSKTAIIGETGCGKTTLVKLLMSFDKPEKGSITINGKDIGNYSPDSIRKRISYISQDIFLFSDSIYNNLRMGNEEISNNEIERICQQCGIDDFIRSMPMGYDTVLEENGNNLSGGQKQRLAIARALLRKPDVLIMDEATSNLDTITENSIKAMIENFSDKMTCIIIAHRLNTIRNCDYIYVMDKGQIAEEGTHDELLSRNGLYSNYVNQ